MLLVKKVKSQKEYDMLRADTPDIKVWGLGKNGNLCQVALPQNKSFLGIPISGGVWDNIYYFPSVNANTFILKMQQAIPEGRRNFLAHINIQIAGWNYTADMTQIIAWANKHDGELTLEILNSELGDIKNILFEHLQSELNDPQAGIIHAANTDQKIKTIAKQKDWLSRFFPWFKVEKVFVDAAIQRTQEEEALIAKMNEQAERRRLLDMQLENERAEREYKISITDLQNNEAEQAFISQLREKERRQALYQKDCEFQAAEEAGQMTKKQAIEKIQHEIEESRHKAKLQELELLRQQQELKNTTEAEAQAHEQYMKKLQLSAEVEEKEHALRMIQLQLAREKTEWEQEQLKKQGELALHEFEMASAKQRNEMSDLELQKDLNRIKAEFERAQFLSQKAKMESEQVYWNKQTELWRQTLNTPDSMFLIDRVGMDFKEDDPMKYTKPVVMAKFQAQQKNTENKIIVNCDVIKKQTRGFSCKKQNVMTYGTEMVFSLNIPMDGYLALLCFEADGGVQLLVPNFANVTPWIIKGTYALPNAECSLIPTDCLTQTARVGGQEHIVAIVSDKPLFENTDFKNQDDFISLSNADYRRFIDKLYEHDLKWAVGYTHYVVVDPAQASEDKFELNSSGIL